MDPFTIAIALAATAVGSIFNIMGSQSASQAQQQQIALEEQVQKQQQAQMELISNRQKVEQVRQAQIARSNAVTNATNQGAGSSSGLQGGVASISGQENFNILGLQQNTQIGENIYGLTYGIDQARIQQAKAMGLSGLGSGISGFGVGMMQNLTAISNLGNSFSLGPTSGTYSGVGAWH